MAATPARPSPPSTWKPTKAHTELWLFPCDGGKARRLTAGDKDSGPQWSPDGKWIAFTAKRKDDDEAQVYLIAPDGGEARRLTTLSTGALALRWFPDSRRIAFVSWVWPDLANDKAQAKRKRERKESKIKAHVTERAEPRYWDHWLADGREPHVFAADVVTGNARDLLAGTGLALQPWDPSAEHYDLSPDGKELALTVDLAPEPRMMNSADIVVVRLATGRHRMLTAGSGFSSEHPRYSPDGKHLAWHALNLKRAFNDQGRLILCERASGRTRRLAARLDRATNHIDWAPDGARCYMLIEDRGRAGTMAAGLDRCDAEPVAAGGTLGGFAVSRDGKRIAFDRASLSHPAALFAIGADGRGELSLESPNRALFERAALGVTREFTVKGWGGDPIQVWVTYPPNFDPKKKWPLLHSIHGGPHAAHTDGWHYRWNTQVFAAHGYVVVGVNYHGSSGFGQQWMETITADYGRREFADTEAATDFMLRRGYIDRNRLVATGGSYGGYMVAYMNGHTDRYRDLCLPCRLLRLGQHDGDRRVLFFAKELGAFHWDNPARVMKQSPHHFAKRFRRRRPWSSTASSTIASRRRRHCSTTTRCMPGRLPTRLVYFPDENHWILKPQNSRLWYREFFDWVKRYAAPGPSRRGQRMRLAG